MFSKFLPVLAAATAAIIFTMASTTSADRPPDLPCVTWEKSSYFVPTPDPNSLFVAAVGWVIQSAMDPDQCIAKGDLIPCWSDDSVDNWGHHDYLAGQIPNDYCRVWVSTGDGVHFAENFYLPKKGPKYQTWKWRLAQTGGRVPADAISHGGKVMAMSSTAPPNRCAGKGFCGFSLIQPGNVFGTVHFAIANSPEDHVTNFKVAICKAEATTMAPTTASPTTTATPTGAPTASPTLPPANKPYLRFGHAVPTSNKVTATITQGSTTYVWKNYGFGKFSGWVNEFSIGNGVVSISDCETGKVLVNQTQYLTPGPLVIVIKGYWPLNQFSIEGIAASYVPKPHGTSGARLFNLMPDVPVAGMTADGKSLVNGIKPYDGSLWADLTEETSYKYAAIDDITNKTLATDEFETPSSPFVFTNFLIGLANATAGNVLAPKFVPLIDAPEF